MSSVIYTLSLNRRCSHFISSLKMYNSHCMVSIRLCNTSWLMSQYTCMDNQTIYIYICIYFFLSRSTSRWQINLQGNYFVSFVINRAFTDTEKIIYWHVFFFLIYSDEITSDGWHSVWSYMVMLHSEITIFSLAVLCTRRGILG